MTALTKKVFIDPEDMKKISDFIEGIGRRASRQELLPIMKAHFAPVVASEKAILSGHSKSGALSGSLAARAGSGDRPGKISVFSAPTATRRQLTAAWSKGRFQQRRWATTIKAGRGRKSVFYASFVELGHRVVKRNAAGELFDTGKRAKPVPFASTAMADVGDSQAEALAAAILSHIAGED